MKKRIIIFILLVMATMIVLPIVTTHSVFADDIKQTEKKIDNANSSKDKKAADNKQAAQASDEEEQSTLLSLFKKGGPFMWPILLFSAVGLGFIIERFIFFARAKLASKEFIDQMEQRISNDDFNAVENLCAESNNKLSKILTKGIALRNMGYARVEKTLTVAGAIEVASLERGLNVLSALGNIVPMLGFLGTVSGMINAFDQIAKADQVKASLVAGGIQEALITTATGLIVAIPVLAFYNYFVHKIENFISDVERISSDIVEILIKKQEA